MDSDHECPKRIKFEDGDKSKGLNVVNDEGKGSVLFSLVPADQILVDKINQLNDDKLETFKLYGPEFKIVSCKKIGTVFDPSTGMVDVRFRTFPFSTPNGKVAALSMNSCYFGELVHRCNTLLSCIYSVEGRHHPDFGTPRDVKKILSWDTKLNYTYSTYHDWHTCKMPLLAEYFVDFRWNSKSKETTVYIYQGSENSSANSWGSGDDKFSLRGGGFELFAREILPKIRNSIRYWGNVYKAGKDTWPSLYSTYEARSEFFNWDKQFGWWMPVEDEDMHGDYEERARQREGSPDTYKIVEEDGRVYYTGKY